MTTWNAMTVAGIALIAGGLTILVVFRRVLWGSGARRRGPALRVTRPDVASARSTGHGGAPTRTDPEPESSWWDEKEPADAVAIGAEPWGQPSRAARRRLRRATAEHGRLASIGLADDEDPAFPDSALTDPPSHDPESSDPVLRDAEDPPAAAVADPAVEDPAPDRSVRHAPDHDAADPSGTDPSGTDVDGTDPHGTDPSGADVDGTDPDAAAVDGAAVRGRDVEADAPDRRELDRRELDRRELDRRELDRRELDRPGVDRHEVGRHGEGPDGQDRREGVDHRSAVVPDAPVAGPADPVGAAPSAISLEPALHRFADLGSVGATPDDDRASRHPGEVGAFDGDRVPTARPAGYRYGDRVDGWVRPDHQQRPAGREPQPAGQYWLPVSDPYADSGYGDHGYGVAPREVAPYEPVPHDVVPHTMSSYEIAPAVEPMPSPPFDASGVLTGERDRPGRDGWSSRSRHASPIDPPSPHFSLFGTPPPTAAPHLGPRYPGNPRPRDAQPYDAQPGHSEPFGPRPDDASPDGAPTDRAPTDGAPTDRAPTDGAPLDGAPLDEAPAGYREPGDPWSGHAVDPDGGPGDLPGDGDTGRGRQSSRRRRAGTARRARADAVPPVDQPAHPRAGYPRAEGRRRHSADLPPVTGETTQKLPPMPLDEGRPRSEQGRVDGARARESEQAGRPRPRPRPRPSGTAPVDEPRQANRSTVYVSRHAADPG